MILSVVVPRVQKAQWERLDEELQGITYEIVPANSPTTALELVSGKYIVFMQEDSAFAPGSLRAALNTFESNPSYRKLAMVAPTVDFDKADDTVAFIYDKNGIMLSPVDGISEDASPVSVGYFYGSIYRTTAFRKASSSFSPKKEALIKSIQISDFFWSNGLRVELHPESVYYAPASYYPSDEAFKFKIKTNSEALKVWKKEFIL